MAKEVLETAEFKLPLGLPFSKGIKKGDHIFVSGSASFNERGEFVGEDDIYKQTQQTLKNILAVIKSAGGTIEDIVKINIYLNSKSDWGILNQAYKDFFGNLPMPARTTIETNLTQDNFLVEIDAEAILE